MVRLPTPFSLRSTASSTANVTLETGAIREARQQNVTEGILRWTAQWAAAQSARGKTSESKHKEAPDHLSSVRARFLTSRKSSESASLEGRAQKLAEALLAGCEVEIQLESGQWVAGRVTELPSSWAVGSVDVMIGDVVTMGITPSRLRAPRSADDMQKQTTSGMSDSPGEQAAATKLQAIHRGRSMRLVMTADRQSAALLAATEEIFDMPFEQLSRPLVFEA